MEINRAEHYYRAALERVKQAEYLYREGASYALAMYTAGVAVESMLRAYRAKRNRAFESRPNVLLLFAESGRLKTGEERLRAAGWAENDISRHTRALQAAVNDVYLLWHNTYRYASEDRLLAHLKKMKLYHRVKGDLLKAKALQLLNATSVFIAKGVLQWH